MKRGLVLALLLALVFVPCVVQAGVLENADLDDYRYEAFGPGGALLTSGIIYSQSVQLDVCADGCLLKLLKTGQTIDMQPNDYILINDGVMKRREG